MVNNKNVLLFVTVECKMRTQMLYLFKKNKKIALKSHSNKVMNEYVAFIVRNILCYCCRVPAIPWDSYL